ncbi:hypothetical protein KIH86_23640 [Paenibacillus sp. HN-1]|uniref:YvrJ family protein n=1 Tax=Paenibacillus TaxID=44249 RepID=UPI001CAA0DD8|nr:MULTISPECIES: YvrJ family protein [Paenibacillus]MBY9081146.1 hypothetical protein [Paenibacillus sp. CGMCC 1.18879]MBY9087183.1 hypothetical protein [Paenibacillus sinensis]
MEISDIVSLIANVGFPVTLCVILVRYVLQTMEEKLEQLDVSIKQLILVIQSLKDEDTIVKK